MNGILCSDWLVLIVAVLGLHMPKFSLSHWLIFLWYLSMVQRHWLFYYVTVVGFPVTSLVGQS